MQQCIADHFGWLTGRRFMDRDRSERIGSVHFRSFRGIANTDLYHQQWRMQQQCDNHHRDTVGILEHADGRSHEQHHCQYQYFSDITGEQ